MKKLSTKIFLATLASGLLVAFISLGGILFSLAKVNTYSLNTIQTILLENYDNYIKSEIETVYSLLEWYNEQVQKGSMTIEEAKLAAVNQIRDLRYGTEGYFWADTSKGDNIVLLGGASEGTNRLNLQDATGKYIIKEILNAGLNGGGFTDYLFPRAGETIALPKRSYSLYFKPFDWVIGTGNYVDDIDTIVAEKKSSIQQMILQVVILMIIVLAGGILVTVFASLFLGRAIAKPIVKVSDILNELSQGDADLTNRLPVITKDEVGQLSKNFNTFLEKLAGIVRAINESMTKTIEIKERMNNGSQETLSALHEISANSASMNTQLQNLDKNIADADKAVHSIKQSIGSVDNGIETQVSAVEESTASVNQMVASLKNVSDVTEKKGRATQELVEISSAGKKNMDDTRSIIAKISDSIGSINEMISMINAVASQTNLLAMNAAIEAAHAGESGRGFAVVAGEIRKLAETSSKNAKDIGLNIKNILVLISEADSSSQRSMQVIEQVNIEVEETAQSLQEILSNTKELFIGGEQILEAMTSLTQVSLQVKENSGEMRKESDIMSSSVSTVADISGEVVAGMNEIAVGTHEITENMASINRQMQVLSEITDSLKGEVGRFKV